MGAKRNLVVIGNGMSGARTVEEILARGGDDLFNIAMYGDESFGNYNRVLLSSVLDGSHAATEILLNPVSRSNAQSWSTTRCARSTIRGFMRLANAFSIAGRPTGWLPRYGSRSRYSRIILPTRIPKLRTMAPRLRPASKWQASKLPRWE